MNAMIRSKIVVIGGGFAAVKCSRTFRKALPREYFSLLFFSKKNHMVFHPMLADVSTSVSSVADFSFGRRLFSLGQGSRPGLDASRSSIWCPPRS
jgi:NADH dehydrogenase FAD-containing subunit